MDKVFLPRLLCMLNVKWSQRKEVAKRIAITWKDACNGNPQAGFQYCIELYRSKTTLYLNFFKQFIERWIQFALVRMQVCCKMQRTMPFRRLLLRIASGLPRAFWGPVTNLQNEAPCELKIFQLCPSDWLKQHFRAFPVFKMSKVSN